MSGNQHAAIAAMLAGRLCGLPEPKPEAVSLWRAHQYLQRRNMVGYDWHPSVPKSEYRAMDIIVKALVSIANETVPCNSGVCLQCGVDHYPRR